MRTTTWILFFLLATFTFTGCQDTGQEFVVPGSTLAAELIINGGDEPVRLRDPELRLVGNFPYAIKGMYVSEDDNALQSGNATWVEFQNAARSVSESARILLRDESPGMEIAKTIHVWLVDVLDNIYPAVSRSFSYLRDDANPPSAVNILIEGGALVTTTSAVDVLVEGNDDIGVTAYLLTDQQGNPSLLDSRWVSVTPQPRFSTTVRFQLSAAGGTDNRTVYLWLRDAYGNVTGPVSDSITYQVQDTQAPVVNRVSINGGAATTATNIVSVAFDATDDYGVVGYLISENASVPSLNNPAWITVSPTGNLSTVVGYTLTQALGLKTVYVWAKDAAGNLSTANNDAIQLTGNLSLGKAWMFFGDSQTAGRANEPDAVSHAIAFRNIWLATYGESVSPHIDGIGGRTLPQTYQSYRATPTRTTASWVHFQESGCQFSDEDTLGEFLAAFESFVRDIVATTPNAVISTETAYSFEAENEPCRDWTNYNTEMRAKIAQLASEGIAIHLAEVDRNIKELVARKRAQLGTTAGQQAVWGDTNNSIGRHYTGLGNLMVALSIYKALGFDVNALDLSGIPDSQVGASDKQLCLDIINAY